jgi:hypothetical protein
MSGDIGDHQFHTLTGSSYGTIHDHCTIYMNGQSDVSIGKVRNHTLITGNVGTLRIGKLEDHSRVCVSGNVHVGETEDHCDVQGNKSEHEIQHYRATYERPKDAGL